jgi:hypothetical protein
MSLTVKSAIEPLIKRKIFDTEEDAIRELLRDYTVRQIDALQGQIHHFEQKYGMRFQQFSQYLHERSALLEQGDLSPEQRRSLGQLVMIEEDDWLDWKVAWEMLENWLGLRQEIGA